LNSYILLLQNEKLEAQENSPDFHSAVGGGFVLRRVEENANSPESFRVKTKGGESISCSSTHDRPFNSLVRHNQMN